MPATQIDVAVRHELMERLVDARRRSDALLGLVRVEALYERPIPERHRIIFYLGHLEAFDWNLLRDRVFGVKNFHPEFDRLFAFGIDPVSGGLPADQPSDWPRLNDVRDYVVRVRTALDGNLASEALEPGDRTFDGVPLSVLLNVAIEHRLMHVETLAYMLHQLPYEQKVRHSDPPSPATARVVHRMVDVPAGKVVLGLPRDAKDFGWDNEYESHAVEVPAFSVDQCKVTNEQYAAFVAAGGYESRSLWNDEDWDWKAAQGISHPVFWKRTDDRWLYRTMFEEVSLPLDWPVYLSHAEATAYARWAGRALPTEAEWQRVASCIPEGKNAFGMHGIFGSGWEWTSSVFSPFPGFEAFPFYRGYSADFFDGKHFVMKGGSPVTAECMLRPSFRNWFQPHYQYVYAGFRCVGR
jgi:gamma-glutamyl hercynylcysteine S-oxide synthase